MFVEPRIPRGVWVLGFVSLAMDVSSEMIHSLLPLFLVGEVGASVFSVGILEGLAEATALIVKVFSGSLSDRWGNRKGLVTVGYSLGALSKPLFALATSASLVWCARLTDRLGKGIRGAPRDALIADITPEPIRGAAFGLRQTLDTVGAFLGPLLAVGILWKAPNQLRLVFWWAFLPGLVSVALIVFGLKQSTTATHPLPVSIFPLSRKLGRQLPAAYWWIVVWGSLFTLARFSEAFLVLRATAAGIGITWVPLVMVLMNLVYALCAYPLGHLSDRLPRGLFLHAGQLSLILANLALADSTFGIWSLALGLLFWGFHLALTQGLLATLVAATAPAALRGTAFGLFNLASGCALLIASVLAGLIWQYWGPAYTFYSGAILASLAWATLALGPSSFLMQRKSL